ncbi:hypothetical protein JFV30_03825 [Pseudomonas sp. TH32]|uniref:hypothetical protein n=1 Tax=Pseudomonas sp. TH32 TaxID=2796397 RepID=UPI001914A8C8|nr:hypothetical protein [Pseudomonas sp. TH32]MBK5436006.1 hypothetical protein [Pseudomonas sp. TH32]
MQQRKKANTALSPHEWQSLWIKPAAVRVTPLQPVAPAKDNANVESVNGVLRVRGAFTGSAFRLEMPSTHWAVRLGDIVSNRLAQACSAQLSLRTNYA